MNEENIAVKIPPGGLKPGFWKNDLTQLMTEEDAELVRKHLPFHKRSGPGLFPMFICGAILGACFGFYVHHIILGLLIGGAILSLLSFLASTSGRFDKQALKAARQAVEKVRRESGDGLQPAR